MGKFLSILVPHYNEEFSVVKPLLDSIRVQQNINLDEIEVVICDDGPDAVDISAELMGYFDLDIKYYREEKGGVSKMRNLAFQHSTGEYVCWCDCDDCFYHCLAFWFIKRETVTPMMVIRNNVQVQVNGFDALYSVFLEESRDPKTGEVVFLDRAQGMQFVHGKVFRRDFLVKNDIHFFDECVIHEDNVLNLQVSACTDQIKWCPAPFYLWKWRDNSVCRRDPLYLKRTYSDLIKSSNCSLEWLVSKSKFDNARETVCSIVFDAYYTFCHPSWNTVETAEYREKTQKDFSVYFKRWEYLWNEAPDQMKMAISNAIRQRTVMEGMEMETMTLSQFLTYIKQLS